MLHGQCAIWLHKLGGEFGVIRLRLLSFHAHINKLSRVLIKGGDRHVLSYGGGGEETVDKLSIGPLIAIQGVERDPYLTDLDAGRRDQASQCGGDIGA